MRIEADNTIMVSAVGMNGSRRAVRQSGETDSFSMTLSAELADAADRIEAMEQASSMISEQLSKMSGRYAALFAMQRS